MKPKTMQDKTPYQAMCSTCGRIIVTADRIKKMTASEIHLEISRHKCVRSRESKRDFEQEVS